MSAKQFLRKDFCRDKEETARQAVACRGFSTQYRRKYALETVLCLAFVGFLAAVRGPHSPRRRRGAKGVPYERPADDAWIFRETPKADESSITKVR